MERPYGKDGTDMLENSRGLTQSLDGRSYAAPPSAYSTFDSPESRYLGSYGASDFSQVMPALSSSSAVMPPTPPLVSSFDGSYVNASSSPNVFPNRRPSISSSVSVFILFITCRVLMRQVPGLFVGIFITLHATSHSCATSRHVRILPIDRSTRGRISVECRSSSPFRAWREASIHSSPSQRHDRCSERMSD